MKSNLIFASHNNHKVSEIQVLFPENINLVSLADLKFQDDIPETGSTLEENAKIKAMTIFRIFSQPCFADDTGLEVQALNGEPGVYSARYAGENATFEDNCNLLLDNMKGIQNRSATFRTVICFIDSHGNESLFEGKIEGEIVENQNGDKGFGYDPIFKPSGNTNTFAQMNLEEKNKLSHRSEALHQLLNFLNSTQI